MIDKQQRLQDRLGPEIQEFRESCQTLQLATLNHGIPHVSYSPFAHTSHGYFILISDIAQHGQNLKHAKSVSIMMIEDEAEAKSIYARRRLTFDTQAACIDKQSDIGVEAIAAMRHRFGEIIDNLSTLGDFNLYQLVPEKGRYVKGFGKAFNVSGDELLSFMHLTEGHVQEQKRSTESSEIS
ncbi:heme utilization protein HutZ [Vibrio genomosp. F10]|uniref:Heme utilization protein HutZ n=1 Tax=Vibrio genomosp. F10 TaxID=723171 RepID=A0A1B9R2Z4_9VIBR|nr:heme utilization protein HutZ [Vibrio genomosp. F10]OCH78670.1 heme utilization protein HutZ [Vibrio genomosp. F10]OEF04720.1 heme utilization protein HutZ [Vibrio genomosp. F10 str. 9ZD137]OEF08463.1 heme utilization protein HutZ [Vibrio genomosp. F10 str. 9ZB36]